MTPQEDWINPPKKKGWSTAFKVIFIIVIVGVLICCSCCGGIGYWLSQQSFNENDPQGAQELATEVLKRPVPEELFAPRSTLQIQFFSFFNLKMAIFEAPQGTGSLVFLKMKLPESANLKEELKNNARGDHLSELFIESGEQKTLDVLEIGPIEFSFIKGKNKENKKETRVVEAVFPGSNGEAVLMIIQMEESAYDEPAILEWLTGEKGLENQNDGANEIPGNGPQQDSKEPPAPTNEEQKPQESQTDESKKTPQNPPQENVGSQNGA